MPQKTSAPVQAQSELERERRREEGCDRIVNGLLRG